MRHDHYILQGKTPLAVDLMTWARWFETADRTVNETRAGKVFVSTVFLGLNHNWNENQPPLLFETMVFRGEFNGEIMRYSTYEEAEAGHELMCDKVFGDIAILEAEVIY